MKHLRRTYCYIPLLLLLMLSLSGCSGQAGVRQQQQQEGPQHPISRMSDTAFTAWLQKLTDSLAAHRHGPDPTQKIPPQWALTDLHILKRVLEEAHTPMYRYATKEQADSAFRSAFALAQDSITYLDLIRSIGRIQSVIACGHSGWGHSAAYKAWRDTQMRLFPFSLKIHGDRAFIHRNHSLQQEIPTGAELLELNGRPMSQVLHEISGYMSKDGNSNSHGTYEIEGNFPIMYSNFIGTPAVFKMKIKPPGSAAVQNLKVKALLKQEIDSVKRYWYYKEEPQGMPLAFEVKDSMQAGIYTIRSFNKEYIRHFGQRFEPFTDSVFKVMADKKLRYLVIDLRDNTGGWTAHGKYLFSYFIDKAAPYMRQVMVKKPGHYSFAPIISSLPGYNDTCEMQPAAAGLYEWKNYPSLWAQPQGHNRFHGQVYILTNGFTRSCSGIFTSLMREHTRAIFIGEETGSAQCGSGGMVMSVRLPYTGISYAFSTARYNCAISDTTNTRGILPDIPIAPAYPPGNPSTDPALQTVWQLIEKDRK